MVLCRTVHVLRAAFAFAFLGAVFTALATPKGVQAQVLQTRERYHIHSGDQLDVRFRLTPEYNQTVVVQPDGFVDLTIAGDVRVASLTITDARKVITDGAVKHLKDPDVTVTLVNFQHPYFVVAGLVARPGKYDMQEDTTAMQALLLAGGPVEGAKVSQVVVFRRINEGGAQVKVLNLKNIKKTSDLERDLTLQPGDMLYVSPTLLTEVAQFMKIGNSLGLYLNPLSVVP